MIDYITKIAVYGIFFEVIAAERGTLLTIQKQVCKTISPAALGIYRCISNTNQVV